MAAKKSRVNINVTNEQRAQITKYASDKGLTITDFILQQCLNPQDQDNTALLEALKAQIQELQAKATTQEDTIIRQAQEIAEHRTDIYQWQQRYDNLQASNAALQHAYMLKTVPFWQRMFGTKQLPNK